MENAAIVVNKFTASGTTEIYCVFFQFRLWKPAPKQATIAHTTSTRSRYESRGQARPQVVPKLGWHWDRRNTTKVRRECATITAQDVVILSDVITAPTRCPATQCHCHLWTYYQLMTTYEHTVPPQAKNFQYYLASAFPGKFCGTSSFNQNYSLWEISVH